MSGIGRFLGRLGLIGLVQLLFYTLILVITTPIRLLQALHSLCCLASEPWSAFSRMSAHRSLNSSWHRSYDLFLERYGRFGYAYEMGLGRNLTTEFHITKFSMRLYRLNEAVIPWLGVLVVVLSQLVWLGEDLVVWVVVATTILSLFSTLFYFEAFEAMKYDSLGWALVPLGYYTLLTGNLWWFSLIFLGITFLSISVTIVQGAAWFFLGLLVQGPLVLVAFLPGGLKLLSHFRFIFHEKDLAVIRRISTGIGLGGSGAKIRRLRLGKRGWYLLGLWIIYWTALWVVAGPSPLLDLSAQLVAAGLPVLLYLINKRFRRFADEQTLYMLVFCSFSLVTLHQPGGTLLPFLWLALSPMPLLLGFSDEVGNRNLIWQVPRRCPYRIGPVREFCLAFMRPVGQGQRVLFHFDYDPVRYPDFDGLRGIKEFLHFLALERQAVLVPDFYLVFDSYAGHFPLAELYEDVSPEGRRAAMEQIGARFLILPAESPELPPSWTETGFVVRTHLDLVQGCKAGFWSKNSYREERPYLLLLEAPELQASLSVCGTILEMSPNRLKVRLDENGEAVVKFLHARGWQGPAGVSVDALPGPIPWTRVRGSPEEAVEIHFDYWGTTSAVV